MALIHNVLFERLLDLVTIFFLYDCVFAGALPFRLRKKKILPQFGPEGLQTEFSFSKDIDSSGWVPMYVPHDVYDTANDFVPKLDREEKARLETRRAQLARAREPKKGTLTKLRAAFGKKMKPSDLDIACPNFPFCANVSIFFFLGFHRV